MIKPIKRILVANRGEIASRIIRTAHSMGIDAVAVFADGDFNYPFIREADLAIALNGTTSVETYLNFGKVLAAAKESRSDAIHPGYGFLAENEVFASAVEDASLIWIGPPAKAIAQMGDKLSAKRLMQEAGVPTLPAVEIQPGQDPKKAADQIGYPLLVKASAGGGGKGMRIVSSESELSEATEAAKREAAAAFGNDTVFVERWHTSTRHVEIQVLGDQYGNIVHCFERECSIQRRHQKIIEESPSPALTHELRERMGRAAVAAAKAVGYVSAGTVEFLLTGEEFWFLEMNTRLQVEHPVTEAVTGLDLVREQILIAQGEALGYSQSDLSLNGHAIESRLYAEDPANDFLPASGTISIWEPSPSTPARFDSGIESGSRVGIEFDPMIAKIIVHASSRREAALRLARVLETTRVMGITTNRDFLASILRTPQFLSGETATDFIERIDPPRRFEPTHRQLVDTAIAVAMMGRIDRQEDARVLRTIQSGWRNTVMPPESVCFRHGQQIFEVRYSAQRNGQFQMDVNDGHYLVRNPTRESRELSLEIDGRRLTFTIISLDDRWLAHGPDGQVELIEQPRFPDRRKDDISGGLTAPMPGNVLSIYVETGDWVEKGQLLLILEAMKMEHRIIAPKPAVVTEIRVRKGDQVANGQLLVVLDEEGNEGRRDD